MESPPIIGFFYGVIGHLFLVDFITDPRLRKSAIFPNLMWMEKNLDSYESLVTCGEGVRHPTTPIQRQSFVLIKP